MDNYNSQSPYLYNSSYGYPQVPPSPNYPYPPQNSGFYPPSPNSAPYPPNSTPSPYPSSPYHNYPPPYNTSHSGPLPYPYSPSAPPPPPPNASHSGPLEYLYHGPPSYSGPLPYPHDRYPSPSVSPSSPQHSLQHHNSFQHNPSSSHYHYQHLAPLQHQDSLSNVPLGVNTFSGHQRQDSSSSLVGSANNHDHINDNTPNYPAVYPPIDDLLTNMNLSDNHPSAPASPPAPAAPTAPHAPPVYHSMSTKYDTEGSIGYPNNSFSSSWEPSYSSGPQSPAYSSLSHSPSSGNLPSDQSTQIVPFSGSKHSLKVMLLHGNLDIWVYEAKNLPNMDMFHKTLGDMFNKLPGNMTSKIEGSVSRKITSDPYVSISVARAVIGRTFVISNSENPVWMQHFSVPIAHQAAEVHFYVKDSDVVGSQLMGVVAIPVEQLYNGGKVEGFFPILNSNGKACKPGAALHISICYTPIGKLSIYHYGVGAGPDYFGVPGTYFPLRRCGKVTLYQDAHVPDGCLPNLKLDYGMQYVHGKCWQDIFDAIRQARRLIYITGWSVWHQVTLVRDVGYAKDFSLGSLLKAKSQEGVRVLLLIWDDPTSRSILGYKTDGIMQTHDEETRRFFKHSSVQVLLCPRTGGKRHSWVKQREVETIYTHHQKTVIVDADAGSNRRKIIAFVGGLDLCDGRYDTPQHPILRTLPTVHADDYHNPTFVGNVAGCPREPWHDLHCKIDGPAAYDILTNFEERWLKASKPHGIKKLKISYDSALLRIERIPDILLVLAMMLPRVGMSQHLPSL